MEQLREAYRTNNDDLTKSWLEYIGKRVKSDIKFNISEAVEILNILESNNISLNKSIIKFDIRSSISITYLAQMEKENLEITLGCLPQNQIKSITTRLLNKYGMLL